MQQIWITKKGSPNTLKVRESTLGDPGPGQLSVKIKYAGINFADLLARMGLYPGSPKPPYVPGFEFSGIVEKAGSEELESWVGKPVLGVTKTGAYSSQILAEESLLIPLNSESELKSAAAIPVNYFTAFGMLITQANLQENEWFLIHGIGGGVGIAALQVARILKAKVIGTASLGKHERLKKMGVENLIDYNSEDFLPRVMEITRGKGADVIIDPIGGSNLERSYKALSSLGRLVNYGFSTAAPGNKGKSLKAIREFLMRKKFDPLEMMASNKGVFGFHLGRLRGSSDFHLKASTKVMEWFHSGAIEPVVDKVFSFQQAAQAHQYIHDHKNIGKVLLSPHE